MYRQQVIEKKRKSQNLNVPMHKKVFEIKPFGIGCLEKFLDQKISKATRTNIGTQTTETDF